MLPPLKGANFQVSQRNTNGMAHNFRDLVSAVEKKGAG